MPVINTMTSNVRENQGIMHKKNAVKRPKVGILPNEIQSNDSYFI